MEAARHQRRNGAMRGAVRARANDVLEDFAELGKDVSRLADAAGKAARAEVTHATKRVSHLGTDLTARARGGATYVATQVREHPGAAIGVTLGAGVLVGLLLSRR
jgi:ElaB/YqjD/DUF883 family membrane-anchored ribosome-binding protein